MGYLRKKRKKINQKKSFGLCTLIKDYNKLTIFML